MILSFRKIKDICISHIRAIFISIPRSCYLAVGVMLITISLLYITTPLSHSVDINTQTTNETYKTSLPFHSTIKQVYEKHDSKIPQILEKEENTTYIFTQSLNSRWYSQSRFRMGFDDCLSKVIVNDKELSLSSIVVFENQKARIANGQLCDAKKQYEIDLSNYLQSGKNTLQVHIQNNGGYAHYTLNHSWLDPVFLTLFSFALLSLFYIVFCIFKAYKIPLFVLALFIISTLVKLHYLRNTNLGIRAYDLLGTGHWGYINHILLFNEIPSTEIGGWQYASPPLYYIFSAITVSSAKILGVFNPHIWLNILSIFMMSVAQFFGILLARKVFTSKLSLFFSSILILFWPASFLHSIRITNDAPFYMTYAMSIYFIIMWWYSRHSFSSQKYFYLGALFTALSLMSKSTALIQVAIILLLLGARCIELYTQRATSMTSMKSYISDLYNKRILSYVLVFILLISSVFGLSISRNWHTVQKPDFRPSMLLVGNIGGLNSNLKVGNTLYNYTKLNYTSYIKTPFANMWNDSNGRQYFFNTMLKTANFGEFTFENDQLIRAQSLNVILLLLCIVFLVLVFTSKKHHLKSILPFIVIITVTIGFLLAYSIKEPFSSNQEFRFILPVFIPFSILLVLLLQRCNRYIFIQYMVYGCILLYGIQSILFYLSV